MKRLVVFFLLCVVTAAFGRADDKLVEASKNAKAKRKKSTAKVITNADVKKSKGVLIDSGAAQTPLPASQPGMVEQFEAAKAAKALSDAKIADVQKQIELLDKELAALEQSYYDENDLQRRDTEIVRRFNEAKRKRDEAVAALAVLVPPTPESESTKPKS